MSTLTDLIAEAIHAVEGVECDHIDGEDSWCLRDARVAAAVVADWLDGLADAHNAKIALIAGVESGRDTSTAHGMRRAAAEARKGADQ